MARVTTALSVSVDGYIAGPGDGREQPLGAGGQTLFDWFSAGDTPSRIFPSFQMSPASAAVFDQGARDVGAVVAGRRTYDISNGFGGTGPIPGVPLFVLTHAAPSDVPVGDPPYTFVTDGIEAAIAAARAAANGRNVGLMGAAVVQQAMRAGLLDEFQIDVVPVLLGGGVRLLDHLGSMPARLQKVLAVDTPEVTHLRYRVVR